MKLSEKRKNYLNRKCINRFGLDFDSVYTMIDELVKEKEKRKEEGILLEPYLDLPRF